MKLSTASINEFKKLLEKRKSDLPKIAENIVKRVCEEGLENNYASTEMLPIEHSGKTISGGIHTTDEKDTYKEFGTGIVGSNSPHVNEMLAIMGWKYDVNEHGEKGWIYPKGDGTFGWTRGLEAQKKFYNAMLRMQDVFYKIAIEEFNK